MTEDISKFKWPPFFDPGEVRFLVQRFYNAASNDAERRVFKAILRRAYEDVMELEILYRELPGVLKGDHAAMTHLREILDQTVRRGIGSKGIGLERRGLMGFTPGPNPPFSPCQPRFLVKPYIISFIIEGIDRIAQGNKAVYESYINILGGLWQQATHLERFYRQAFRGVEADGRDRLAENLRLIARDSRISERLPGKERFGRADGEERFSSSLAEGRGERPSVTGDLWPPSPGDEPIPIIWPPVGGETPGLPSDFCELVQDACRTMVLGGAASLTIPLPVSTYADGIRWIMPATACAGETITIHGSGFGVSRPENVNVLIGGMVAGVVSWSDTEIVIKVPEGATSGCVGFRNETIEGGRFSQYQQNQRAMGEISEGLSCLGKGVKWPHQPPYVPSLPPCTGVNYFVGTAPEIDFFQVNGRTDLTVEPNTELILTWQVRNPTTIHISRTSSAGPGRPEYVDPSGNILDLGAFTGTQPVDATYKLTATNQCASVTSTVSAHLHVRRLSFATDIRPLFREKDIQAMRPRGLDLSSYQDVKQNAQAIYRALHPTASFTMPCDGPWPADWVATFKLWMDQGMAP